jgi:hypothetical protein
MAHFGGLFYFWRNRMTEEVLIPEVGNEIEESQDDAAFAAGFSEARGEEPPALVEQPEDEQIEMSPEPEEQAPQEDTPEELFAGLTRGQLMEGLQRGLKAEEDARKAFGKIGELQRNIQNMQQSGTGSAVEITSEDFADLAEDYPDLAEKIARGINGKFRTTAAPQGSAFDPTILDARVAEVEDRITKKYEARMLDVRHPNWRDETSTADFDVWKGTLPPEAQLELSNSWDSVYLGNAISSFKDWKLQSTNTKQQRSNRLEAAITPQGVPVRTSAQSDDDAFSSGFNQIRKGIF